MTLLPEDFDRTTWVPAVFLTAIPVAISALTGALLFRGAHGDLTFVSFVAGAVGGMLAAALSIRGGEPLFCVFIGCALVTLCINVLRNISSSSMPIVFAVILAAMFITITFLSVRLVLEAVMPRAQQFGD